MSSGNWKNADGLYLEFGTTKPAVDVAGEYRTNGDFREINIRLDPTTLSITTPTIISQNLKFPTGMRIARIDVISDTACVGSGATLDLGLIAEDRTTEIDYNGLLAAVALTSFDTVGETNSYTVGVSGAGALMGTSTTSVGYLVANTNTALISAGALNIRIFLYGRGVITQ